MPSCYQGQFDPAGSTTAWRTCRGSSSRKFANGVDGRGSLCRRAWLPLDDFHATRVIPVTSDSQSGGRQHSASCGVRHCIHGP